MLPIWLIVLAVIVALAAAVALCRWLLQRAKKTRDKRHILRRVADLEEQRRGL